MKRKKIKFRYIFALLLLLIGSTSLSENNFKNFLLNKMSINFKKPNLSGTEGTKNFYYPNGSLQSKQFYINNKKSGVWEFYYENGTLKSTASFKVNSPVEEAFVKNYDEQGILMSSGTLINGEMVSLWKYYDENGKIIHSFDHNKREIVLFNEEEKPILLLKEDEFAKRMQEIQKEINDDRIRSSQEKN